RSIPFDVQTSRTRIRPRKLVRLRSGQTRGALCRSIPGAIWLRKLSARRWRKGSTCGRRLRSPRRAWISTRFRTRWRSDGCSMTEMSCITTAGSPGVRTAMIRVWIFLGFAEGFGTTELSLRRSLFEQTAGMFPELVTRLDLHVFLPPIGGTTVYLFGDVAKLSDARTRITCRVHDECNGSDVFGSDICTCRP